MELVEERVIYVVRTLPTKTSNDYLDLGHYKKLSSAIKKAQRVNAGIDKDCILGKIHAVIEKRATEIIRTFYEVPATQKGGENNPQ